MSLSCIVERRHLSKGANRRQRSRTPKRESKDRESTSSSKSQRLQPNPSLNDAVESLLTVDLYFVLFC